LRDDFGICIKNNHRVTASGCLGVSLIHPLIQQRQKYFYAWLWDFPVIN
jgi:hypothetical protein